MRYNEALKSIDHIDFSFQSIQIASICDIVLNHTANESEWLLEHPDAAYSCFSMPHLRPAFLLDVVFGLVTHDTAAGLLESVGVPRIVATEDHIQALRHQLHTNYLPKANLCQLYQCDIEKYIRLFSDKVRTAKPGNGDATGELKLLQDSDYRRLQTTIDFDLAVAKYNVYR